MKTKKQQRKEKKMGSEGKRNAVAGQLNNLCWCCKRLLVLFVYKLLTRSPLPSPPLPSRKQKRTHPPTESKRKKDVTEEEQ
jgi:hypothetical protein